MPVTFPLPTSDVTGGTVRYLGYWIFSFIGGHNSALAQGSYSQIDTKITVTTATNTVKVGCFGGSTQPFDVYLDGVLQTRPTLSGSGAWVTDQTILTNIAVGSHNITLKSLTATLYFDTDYGLQVSDAAATIAAPDNFGANYPVQSAPLSTNARFEGGWVPFDGLNYPSNKFYGTNFVDASIKFRTDASQIRAFVYAGSGKYVVYQDGVQIVAPTVVTGASTMNLLTLASGLDTTTVHEYEIRTVTGPGFCFYFTSLMLVGGAGLATTAYAVRGNYMVLGDSITQANVESNDSRLGYVFKFSQNKNVAVVNGGTAGYKSADLVGNMAVYTAFAAGFIQSWSVLIGTNDITGGISTATFQTNLTSIVNSLKTQYPAATGNLIKILPRNDAFDPATVASFNSVVATVATNTGVSLRDLTTGPGGTFTKSGTGDLYDTVHPSQTGHTKLALNLAPLLIPNALLFRRGFGIRRGFRSLHS
jgi:lysophospholipase L1-like esterase